MFKGKIESGSFYRLKQVGTRALTFPLKFISKITPGKGENYIYYYPAQPDGKIRANSLQYLRESAFRERAEAGPFTLDDLRKEAKKK